MKICIFLFIVKKYVFSSEQKINIYLYYFKSSTRSSLGWEMIRLLKEVKVKLKYVIFENVANITSKAFNGTLKLFKQYLMDLDYSLYDKVLNAVDYGIPQTGKRYFLVAILGNDKEFKFINGQGCNKTLLDYLEKEVNEKYLRKVLNKGAHEVRINVSKK